MSAPQAPSLDGIDLTDLDLFLHGDPYAAFATLRREAPVYWHDRNGRGFWAVTKYSDALRVYHDPASFSCQPRLSKALAPESCRPNGNSQKMLPAMRWRRSKLLLP